MRDHNDNDDFGRLIGIYHRISLAIKSYEYYKANEKTVDSYYRGNKSEKDRSNQTPRPRDVILAALRSISNTIYAGVNNSNIREVLLNKLGVKVVNENEGSPLITIDKSQVANIRDGKEEAKEVGVEESYQVLVSLQGELMKYFQGQSEALTGRQNKLFGDIKQLFLIGSEAGSETTKLSDYTTGDVRGGTSYRNICITKKSDATFEVSFETRNEMYWLAAEEGSDGIGQPGWVKRSCVVTAGNGAENVDGKKLDDLLELEAFSWIMLEPHNKRLKDSLPKKRDVALARAEEYLRSNPAKLTSDRDLGQERSALLESLRSQTLTKDLIRDITNQLREIRDLRTGVVIHKYDDCDPPVHIRDARNCHKPYRRAYESAEMSLLNTINTALDLLDRNEMGQRLQEEAKAKLQKIAIDFISENQDLGGQDLSVEQRKEEVAKRLNKKVKDVAIILAQNGVEKPFECLNEGKDYQNFNFDQADIITISEVEVDRDKVLKKGADKIGGSVKKIVIEAEIGLRGLTLEQIAEYKAIQRGDQDYIPQWFNAISANEQEFVKKYVDQILAGKHVHPTQLRRIAGIKNSFEKITAVFEDDKIEELHSSLHAGTLGSANKDKHAAQSIVNANLRQVQHYLGEDQVLHCDTFNTEYPVPVGGSAKDDQIFVKQTRKAARVGDAKHTNTAFNLFRRLAGASDYRDLEDSLKTVSESIELESDKKLEAAIKSYVEPKGFFGRAFRTLRYGSKSKLIDNIEKTDDLGDHSKDLLKSALKLAGSIETAKSSNIDLNNANLEVNQNLNFFSYKLEKIKDAQSQGNGSGPFSFKGLKWFNLPVQKILNMCASGKDRAGLAEHNQTSQSLVDNMVKDDKDLDPKLLLSQIDQQIIAAGHTGNMAGDPVAGGGTIGAYGTKSNNEQGIPNRRTKDLKPIVEPESKFNKIKGKITSSDRKKQYEAAVIESRIEDDSDETTSNSAPSLTFEHSYEESHHLHPTSAHLQTRLARVFFKYEQELKDDLDSGTVEGSQYHNQVHDEVLEIFKTGLEKQKDKPLPDEPYKGIGLSLSLEKSASGSSHFKILEVASLDVKRFYKDGKAIDPESLKGKKITEIIVTDSNGVKTAININDLIKTKSHKDAFGIIASHFHGDDEISFRTSDGSLYECKQKMVFIGQDSAVNGFKYEGSQRLQKYDPEKHGLPTLVKLDLERFTPSVREIAVHAL